MAKRFTTEDNAEECPAVSAAFGARYRGEPHLAYHRHLPCKQCKADMGCVRCSGPTSELLCRNCKDWAHPDSLAGHGELVHEPARRQALLNMLGRLLLKSVGIGEEK